MEQLGQLKPAFRAGGSVTAGNSSGLNDGAAALVLMSDRKAQELGLKPLARWVGSAVAGVSPRVMGLGPIGATRKVLTRTGIAHREIDLVELTQAIAVLRELELSEAITNVNGGAIALGHPLGCSGARISTTLIHELHRRKDLGQQARYGLATLCVGVGQGEATIFERL
jgi:acetyl-CoA acetyltransferase family protein